MEDAWLENPVTNKSSQNHLYNHHDPPLGVTFGVAPWLNL